MAISFENQCEEFSFFRLPDIKRHVKRYLQENKPLLAKQYLIRLSDFMSANHDKIYPIRSFLFWHLRNYPDFDEQIQRMIKEIEEVLAQSEKPKSRKKGKITVNELALYLWYDRSFVPENQWDIIAKDYGFDNGDKLKQNFNSYSSKAFRRADPGTKATLIHKIKRFEKVRNMLEEGKRGKIEDEIGILEGFLLRY